MEVYIYQKMLRFQEENKEKDEYSRQLERVPRQLESVSNVN